MVWFAVWTALVLLAALVLGRLAWTVFRKGVAVVAAVGSAGERASALAREVERIGEGRRPGDLAVFADPSALREERLRRQRARRRVQVRRRPSRA